tara:strand:- start:12520 stop:13212 length:693 start_codon:yes stop_codon:yes gene_type:complete
MSEPTFTLPYTKEQISAALGNVINSDAAPTSASIKMVTSAGVKSYVDNKTDAISLVQGTHDTRITALEAKPQVTGWELHADSQYTTASRLAVNNARVQLTINKIGAAQDVVSTPLSSGSFWTDDVMYPQKNGDAFVVELSFDAQAQNGTSWFDVEFDISSLKDGSDLIFTDTVAMTKGTNLMHITKTYSIYARAGFLANGCAIFLNTSASNDSVAVFDTQLLISRTHSPV